MKEDKTCHDKSGFGSPYSTLASSHWLQCTSKQAGNQTKWITEQKRPIHSFIKTFQTMKRTNHNKLSFRIEFLSGFIFLGYDNLSIIGIYKFFSKDFFSVNPIQTNSCNPCQADTERGKRRGSNFCVLIEYLPHQTFFFLFQV